MGIEATIYGRLSNDATLTQLVGQRIYPTAAAENNEAMPFCVYTVSSRENMLTLDGPSQLRKYGLDVDVYALDVAQVKAVQAAVETLLHGWRDTGDGIQLCHMTNETTMPEDPAHHGMQSFAVWANS